jgi:hypothetical protein
MSPTDVTNILLGVIALLILLGLVLGRGVIR